MSFLTEPENSTKSLLQAAHRFHMRATAVMILVTYWMMILTFRSFFFFNPMAEASILRQLSLWLCLVGWIIASLGTPVIFWFTSNGVYRYLRYLPITALLWPASILISQLTSFIVTKQIYLNYLRDYPVFIITDIAIPALAIYKWKEMTRFAEEFRNRY